MLNLVPMGLTSFDPSHPSVSFKMLLLLISSLIWERLEDRKQEGSLLDEDN
jgi:hypothetical protein